MRLNWSKVQSSCPNAWEYLVSRLEKKGAVSVKVVKNLKDNLYVKITWRDGTFDKLSSDMLYQMFDECGKRIILEFNADEDGFLWGFIIYTRNKDASFWTEGFVKMDLFKERSLAETYAFDNAFTILEDELETKKNNLKTKKQLA